MDAWIDTHCHLADARFADDLPDVLARSRAAGVSRWIVPTARHCEWARACRISAQYPGIRAAYGIHPWFCDQYEIRAWRQGLDRLEGAVAIGETGLDFGPGRPPASLQRQWLRLQMDMAQTSGLPVILHAHKSLDMLIGELRRRRGVRGVVHGFAGSRQQAERLIDLGFFLGIGTRILRPGMHRFHELVAWLPASSLLLESDAPDQPPAGWTRNEPRALLAVAEAVARIRGQSLSQLAAQCNANARRLFGQ